MNEETMRKHYEATPKDRLINILISARKEFDKLKNKNKECKQEIERLNNVINKVLFILEHLEDDRVGYEACIELLKGSDK